jgi:GT2 family glycosyltransferase
MHMSKKRIGVVVVSYGNTDDVAGLVKSLQKQLAKNDKLMIVDNKKPWQLKKYFNNQKIKATVAKHDNGGFGAGCNFGAAQIIGDVDVLLFINPDMSLEQPDFISKMRRGYDEYDVWGGVIINANDGKLQIRDVPQHITGLSWSGGFGEDPKTLTQDYSVSGVSGGCLAIKTELYHRLGGFIDEYFMYFEDRDLCTRALLAGAKLGYLHDARILHNYEYAKSGYKWKYLERNRLMSMLITWPARLLVLTFLPNLIFNLAVFLQYLFSGKPHLKIWADINFLREIPFCLQERAIIKKSIKISRREFFDSLTYQIDTQQLGALSNNKIVDGLFGVYYKILRLFM